MSKLLLEMEVLVFAEPIRVRVVDDDGPVSYAEIEFAPGDRKPPERCFVTTADRRARWEYGVDGDWRRTVRAKVSHDEDVRQAMERAARAGLVAAGHAS